MDTSKATIKTIDEYIASFPQAIQEKLEKIRETVKQAAPDAVEGIKYQMPTFMLHGGNLIHFAAFKNHIGLYPTPSGIDAFKDELVLYASAKGSAQFSLSKPVPYELIRKITQFRVKTTAAKMATKKAAK